MNNNISEEMVFNALNDAIESFTRNEENASEVIALFYSSICSIDYDKVISLNSLTGNWKDVSEYITTKHDTGLGGGQSYKIRNVFLNWKKVFYDNFFEGVSSIGGALEKTFLIPFAAISAAVRIFKDYKVPIDERQSMILVTLWRVSNGGRDTIPRSTMLDPLNKHLSSFKKNELTDVELDLILEDLYQIRTIDYNEDGTISLIEKVKVI